MAVKDNLVDAVWGVEKPARPNEKVQVLPLQHAGKSFSAKIEALKKELDKKKSAGFVVCMPHNIPERIPCADSYLSYA